MHMLEGSFWEPRFIHGETRNVPASCGKTGKRMWDGLLWHSPLVLFALARCSISKTGASTYWAMQHYPMEPRKRRGCNRHSSLPQVLPRKRVSGHFLFDGFRLALLRPSYRGRRAGVDSFRFLRLLMASPQSISRSKRRRSQRVPSWSRPPDDRCGSSAV